MAEFENLDVKVIDHIGSQCDCKVLPPSLDDICHNPRALVASDWVGWEDGGPVRIGGGSDLVVPIPLNRVFPKRHSLSMTYMKYNVRELVSATETLKVSLDGHLHSRSFQVARLLAMNRRSVAYQSPCRQSGSTSPQGNRARRAVTRRPTLKHVWYAAIPRLLDDEKIEFLNGAVEEGVDAVFTSVRVELEDSHRFTLFGSSIHSLGDWSWRRCGRPPASSRPPSFWRPGSSSPHSLL